MINGHVSHFQKIIDISEVHLKGKIIIIMEMLLMVFFEKQDILYFQMFII